MIAITWLRFSCANSDVLILSSKHQYREKETELTHDEEVMAASLHSYFGDLLKQTGPVRVDDTKFAEAMAALDPECRRLVARYQILTANKIDLSEH